MVLILVPSPAVTLIGELLSSRKLAHVVAYKTLADDTDHHSRLGYKSSFSGLRNERRRRELLQNQLQTIFIDERLKLADVDELWFGSALSAPALIDLLPASNLFRIDHGIGDVLNAFRSKGVNRTSWQSDLRYLAEKILLGFPSQSRRDFTPIKLMDLQLNESIQQILLLWEYVKDRLVSNHLDENRTVFLAPPMSLGVDPIIDFLVKTILKASNLTDSSTIFLKAHSADSQLGTDKYLNEVANRLREMSSLRIEILRPEIPAELFAVGSCALVSPLSTTILNTRIFSPKTVVFGFEWKQTMIGQARANLQRQGSPEWSDSFQNWLDFNTQEFSHFEPLWKQFREENPILDHEMESVPYFFADESAK